MSINFTVGVKSAVAWKLVEGLCRRPRPGLKLAVATHLDCNATYVFVSLMRRDRWEQLIAMNLNGTILSVNPVEAPRKRLEELPWHETGYVAGVLTRGVGPVVDDIEALLGLPEWTEATPTTTPPLLAIRVIAGVMQRGMFRDDTFLASSGLDENGQVHQWMTAFPEVHAAATKALGDRDLKTAERRAARVWRLSLGNGSGPSVLLDLATADALCVGKDADRVQLHNMYATNGRRLGPLVEWVCSHIKE